MYLKYFSQIILLAASGWRSPACWQCVASVDFSGYWHWSCDRRWACSFSAWWAVT